MPSKPGDVPDLPAEFGAPSHPLLFPILGLGASAGGLAAFEAFFSVIPPDLNTGMAFVLVQHLAPVVGRLFCVCQSRRWHEKRDGV